MCLSYISGNQLPSLQNMPFGMTSWTHITILDIFFFFHVAILDLGYPQKMFEDILVLWNEYLIILTFCRLFSFLYDSNITRSRYVLGSTRQSFDAYEHEERDRSDRRRNQSSSASLCAIMYSATSIFTITSPSNPVRAIDRQITPFYFQFQRLQATQLRT